MILFALTVFLIGTLFAISILKSIGENAEKDLWAAKQENEQLKKELDASKWRQQIAEWRNKNE